MSNIRSSKRTDLASELIKSKKITLNEFVSRTEVTLDEEAAVRLGKPMGNYITLASPVVARGEREQYRRLQSALSDALSELLPKKQSCMVVGLGNPTMTADALGSSVVKRIRVTRGFTAGNEREVCTLCPGVLGVTGVESYDVVKGVTERVRPGVIIAVDSLCAASAERLSTAFQLTDTGIAPGSGVSGYKFRLDRDSLGVPVISVGVPLVVYASTLGEGADEELVVTPKDVDILVEESAEIIAAAINVALS